MRRIIAQTRADVTGDGRAERVFLTGIQQSGSVAWQDIALHIRDGASGRETRIALSEDAGYNPRIFIGSFTRPGSADILISIDSGGSGAIGYYTIIAFMDRSYRRIFETSAYNQAYTYTVNYLDQYTVRVESLSNDMVYLIDIANRDAEYLSGIYTQEGTLIAPQEGFVDPLSLLVPADIDGDGVFELLAYQRVSGLYHADVLGDVINTLFYNYDGRQFSLRGQTLGILGIQRQM